VDSRFETIANDAILINNQVEDVEIAHNEIRDSFAGISAGSSGVAPAVSSTFVHHNLIVTGETRGYRDGHVDDHGRADAQEWIVNRAFGLHDGEESHPAMWTVYQNTVVMENTHIFGSGALTVDTDSQATYHFVNNVVLQNDPRGRLLAAIHCEEDKAGGWQASFGNLYGYPQGYDADFDAARVAQVFMGTLASSWDPGAAVGPSEDPMGLVPDACRQRTDRYALDGDLLNRNTFGAYDRRDDAAFEGTVDYRPTTARSTDAVTESCVDLRQTGWPGTEEGGYAGAFPPADRDVPSAPCSNPFPVFVN
jgi:hypothetical protein